MDSDLVVVYCQDGYIALDSVFNFLTSAGSQTQARKQIFSGGPPSDVQMGVSYITLTSGDGSSAIVVSKSDLEVRKFDLDLTTSPAAILRGAYLSPLYLVLWVNNNQDNFI
jgi:hypothetical protein